MTISLSRGAHFRGRPPAGSGSASPLSAPWSWPGSGPSGKARSGPFNCTRSAGCSSGRTSTGTGRSAGPLNCARHSSRSNSLSYPCQNPRSSPCSTTRSSPCSIHRRLRHSRPSCTASSIHRHSRPRTRPPFAVPPSASEPRRSWRPLAVLRVRSAFRAHRSSATSVLRSFRALRAFRGPIPDSGKQPRC